MNTNKINISYDFISCRNNFWYCPGLKQLSSLLIASLQMHADCAISSFKLRGYFAKKFSKPTPSGERSHLAGVW